MIDDVISFDDVIRNPAIKCKATYTSAKCSSIATRPPQYILLSTSTSLSCVITDSDRSVVASKNVPTKNS